MTDWHGDPIDDIISLIFVWRREASELWQVERTWVELSVAEWQIEKCFLMRDRLRV
jgi:hypothetical protein